MAVPVSGDMIVRIDSLRVLLVPRTSAPFSFKLIQVGMWHVCNENLPVDKPDRKWGEMRL